MTDVETRTTARRVPRALTPFRHPGYRRLALAMVLATFAGGVWLVGLVWEVIGIGGGPAQLSVVSTAAAVGVVVPALLGGVVADRVPQKLILLAVASLELTCMTAAALLSLAGVTRLWELAALCETAGAVVLDGLLQRRPHPDPSTYLGKGKAEELRSIVAASGAEARFVEAK